jgi:hypothetical protein
MIMHLFLLQLYKDFEMPPASWGYPHYKCSNFVHTSRSIGTEVWESLVSDIPAGDGKIAHLSYSVHCCRARLFRSRLGLSFARTPYVGGAGSRSTGEMGLISLLTVTFKKTYHKFHALTYCTPQITINEYMIKWLSTCIKIMLIIIILFCSV